MNEINEKLILDFGRATVNFLKKQNVNSPIKMTMREIVEFHEDGSWSHGFENKLNIRIALVDHLNEISELSEVKKIIHACFESGVLKLPEKMIEAGQEIPDIDSEPMRYFLMSQISRVVQDYFNTVTTLDFNEDEFRKSYIRYENNQIQDTLTMVVFIPLFGFACDVDKIDFNNGVLIERLTAKEKTRLWDPFSSSWGFFNILDFSGCKFKIVGRYKRKRKDSTNNSEIKIIAMKCMTALRLLHEGEFGAALIEATEPPHIWEGIGSSLIPDYGIPRFKHPPYKLENNEIESFISLFQKLASKKAQQQISNFELGLRRFNQSYSRENTEDKIIDLVIALESTLLYGFVDGEFSYRLALRGASLLSKKRSSKETFNVLRALYDARSKIVHSGKSFKDIGSNEEIKGIKKSNFISISEQITREVFIEYLDLLSSDNSLEKINLSLEQNIAESLGHFSKIK
ncbi:MAG: hypothetical protein KAI43_07335 [Candidatus Aureabacteria bacterium]|nr:hypothetical protein [Candidatus Auribacterota bacterium]